MLSTHFDLSLKIVTMKNYSRLPSMVVLHSNNSSICEKLLGITIDSDFTFEEHFSTFYRKARQKLYA